LNEALEIAYDIDGSFILRVEKISCSHDQKALRDARSYRELSGVSKKGTFQVENITKKLFA
jgi:hypothetical protein